MASCDSVAWPCCVGDVEAAAVVAGGRSAAMAAARSHCSFVLLCVLLVGDTLVAVVYEGSATPAVEVSVVGAAAPAVELALKQPAESPALHSSRAFHASCASAAAAAAAATDAALAAAAAASAEHSALSLAP